MDVRAGLSTRKARITGAGVLAGGSMLAMILTGLPASAAGAAAAQSSLPVGRIQNILQADGTVSDGVLTIEQSRSDLSVRGGRTQTRFEDGFQIQNSLTFQRLGSGSGIFNGDMALTPDEIQPVIDAILANGLFLQAEHQHLYDIRPMVWFIHFRGVGDPVSLARKVRAVVSATHTPLPQHAPAHPTTPLPAQRLAAILGGTASVGENGIVTVNVLRSDRITLAGHPINPELNITNNIQFQPLGDGKAAAVPDFAMTAAEINPVMRTMRGYGWEVGCLYNQETAESPQLYFSHVFNVGDPLSLARQIRAGLDRTAAEKA